MLDIKEIKNLLPNYLLNRGININRNFHCLAPNHSDNTPSMRYHAAKQRVKCFGCGWSGDLIDIIKHEYNIGTGEAILKAKEVAGIIRETSPRTSTSSYKNKQETGYLTAEEYITKAHSAVNKTSFFFDRGFSPEIISKYKLGYDEIYNCAVFPIGKNYFFKRGISRKVFYNQKGTNVPFFNNKVIYDKICILTESVTDAISIEIATDTECMALNGVNNAERFVEMCATLKTKSLIVLALDNDTTGINTAKIISDKLTALSIENKTISFEPYKDANEMLCKTPKELKNIILQKIINP